MFVIMYDDDNDFFDGRPTADNRSRRYDCRFEIEGADPEAPAVGREEASFIAVGVVTTKAE